MRRFFVTIAAVFFAFAFADAQNVGYVDTDAILDAMPEYQKAQQELNTMADRYMEDIDSQREQLDQLYKTYQARKDGLSSSERSQREKDIITFERDLQKRQQTWFGENGVMEKKSETLLSPIRNKVQNAIDVIAKKFNCSIIIDVAAVAGIVYKDPAYDITGEVKKYLNIK